MLEGLQRLGNRLWLQITITGCRRTANMEWDPLPAVGGVEVVLLGSIGAKIRLGVGMLLGRFMRRRQREHLQRLKDELRARHREKGG